MSPPVTRSQVAAGTATLHTGDLPPTRRREGPVPSVPLTRRQSSSGSLSEAAVGRPPRTDPPRPAAVDPSTAGSPSAPVRLLDRDEISGAVQRFAASLMDGWVGSGQVVENPSDEQIAWHARLGETAVVLSKLTSRTDFALGCFFDGEPIGLATIDNPRDGLSGPDRARSKGLKVVHAVTHPGAAGAGGALMERAVNLSQAQGYEGKLHLYPMSLAAASAYKALGFVQRGVEMTLTPSSPTNRDRWVHQDGEWRLKKYLTKEVVSGMNALQARSAG